MSFGHKAVDYQERVNFERLRRERVERAREQLKAHGLGAFLVFNSKNVRYLTGVRPDTRWIDLFRGRFTILTESGEPHLFELGGDWRCVAISAPWLKDRLHIAESWGMAAPHVEKVTERWADAVRKVLKDEGVEKEVLGTDSLDNYGAKALEKVGIKSTDGNLALGDARSVKTQDELQLLKMVHAINDAAYAEVERVMRPGMKESDIAVIITKELFELGDEGHSLIIVASGNNSNPYRRSFTDRVIQYGDLVIVDMGGIFNGYVADTCRTYFCGAKATEEQKEAYRECYEMLYKAIRAIRPGRSTAEIAKLWPAPYRGMSALEMLTLQHGHGMGLLGYDPPFITQAYSPENPQEIKENMFLCVETYVPSPDGYNGVRLEEGMVVTSTGVEIASKATIKPEELDWMK